MRTSVVLVLAGVLGRAPSLAQAAPALVDAGGETFVASVVVTAPPYAADATGRTDAVPAIQRALDDVGDLGGGVVFLPAGRYRLDGALKVPYAVTLLGAGAGVPAGSAETLLVASAAPFDRPLLDANAFECGLLHLSVWYPGQQPDDVVAYPFTISGSGCHIRDVTLYNSFNGVELRSASVCAIENVRGTVLRRGIVAPESGEFSWVHDVHFANRWWRDAAARLTGARIPTEVAAALDTFTRQHLVGLELGRIDGMAIYRYSAADARQPILIEKDAHANQHPVFGFGGVVAGFTGARSELGWDPWYYGMHYANLDNVPQARGASYAFAVVPGPSRRGAGSLYDVRAAPYGAVGDGVADDTSPIEAALRDAGRDGGGTVYLRQGVYKVTRPLVVPPGVELRGAIGVGKARSFRETCALAACTGAGAAAPETDPALLTLMDHAGVRGLEIVYPDQPYDVARLVPYPYAVRGRGAGVWVADTLLVNAYLGIDLAAYRCDEHRIVGVWGLAFQKGLTVGGGSRGGQLERIAFSYGPWAESGRVARLATAQGAAALASHCQANSTHYTFGSCDGETAWGLAGFAPRVHIHLADDGGPGCTRASFWQSLLDVGSVSDVRADAGQDVRFYGIFATGGTGKGAGRWLEVSPTLKGPVRVYAPTLQQTCLRHPYDFRPGQVELYGEASLAAGRPVSSVGPGPSGTPSAAVDGDWRTCWECTPGAALQVDLGRLALVDRFGVEGDLASSRNPIRQAELWTSRDGRTFRRASVLPVNGLPWADRPVEPIAARYVRLRVLGMYAAVPCRISTFRVFGPAGADSARR